jgi:hypothetical protein
MQDFWLKRKLLRSRLYFELSRFLPFFLPHRGSQALLGIPEIESGSNLIQYNIVTAALVVFLGSSNKVLV